MTEPGTRLPAPLAALQNSLRRLWPLGLMPIVTGCSMLQNQQSYMVTHGPVAHHELDVFMVSVYVTIAIFIVVTSCLLYAVFRFEDKGSDPSDLPPQVHGNALIEGTLGVVSALMLVLIAVPTVKDIWYMTDVPADEGGGVAAAATVSPTTVAEASGSPEGSGSPAASPGAAAAVAIPNGPLNVVVTGHQWWWQFDYPDLGITTADELHIPTGRAVAIKELSVDVIHSFWVPQLAGKMDVIPGQENHMWFKADDPGIYYGQCTEFCGSQHAMMGLRCVAESPDDFQKWVNHQKEDSVPAGPDVKAGEQVAETICAACHTIKGVSNGVIGPDLTHLMSRQRMVAEWMPLNNDNLHRWLHDPQAVKADAKMLLPGLHGTPGTPLTDQDIDNVIKYLDTLK